LWNAADAFEEGRALGHLYNSGHDRDSGVAAFPESFARFEGLLKRNPVLLRFAAMEEAGTRCRCKSAPIETSSRSRESGIRVRMNMQALNDAMLDQLERLFEGTRA